MGATSAARMSICPEAAGVSICPGGGGGAGDSGFEGRTTDWHSIYLAALMTFVSAMQFSLYFSSLWPFMREVG